MLVSYSLLVALFLLILHNDSAYYYEELTNNDIFGPVDFYCSSRRSIT